MTKPLSTRTVRTLALALAEEFDGIANVERRLSDPASGASILDFSAGGRRPLTADERRHHRERFIQAAGVSVLIRSQALGRVESIPALADAIMGALTTPVHPASLNV